MFIPRKIYSELKRHLKKKPITVITGMRRTGKTTILKQLLLEIKSENKLYLDLERLDNRELFAEKNYENIIQALKERGLNFSQKVYLIIDEIQLVPEIPSILKYLYDQYDIKFVASGSSSFYLKNLFAQSLAGRKKIFELFPLDFSEFLRFKNLPFVKTDFRDKKFSSAEYERLKNYYEEFIQFGGFPEVVLAKTIEDKKDLLSDILSSYINIDIKTLADFRNERTVYALMKMLAGRIGSRLDYAKLSRLSGISRSTVQNYLDFFEKTYLIQRVSVIAKNPDREIVKAQKLYFCDNGIIGLLAEINSGSKFENAIFNQLKHFGKLSYYALKTGKEIDFVLENNLALEVKESATEFDLKDLADLSAKAKIPHFRLIGRHPVPNFSNYIWGGEIR